MKWKFPLNSRELKEEPDDRHDDVTSLLSVGIFTKLRDRECGEGVEDGFFFDKLQRCQIYKI